MLVMGDESTCEQSHQARRSERCVKKAIILWLLRRLGYPTHKLVDDAPSMLAVVLDGAVVFTTTQSPHVARAKCRELRAIDLGRVRLVLYRAVREEEP